MQVLAGDTHVRVPRRAADFGEGPPTRQRVADERLPAVVDGQLLKACRTQHFADRPDPLT